MAPLTIENSFALVGGGAASKEEVMQEIKVKIIRAFLDHQKRVTKVGEIVNLPWVFALEMIAAHKAERVEDPIVPSSAVPAPAREPAKKEGGSHVK